MPGLSSAWPLLPLALPQPAASHRRNWTAPCLRGLTHPLLSLCPQCDRHRTHVAPVLSDTKASWENWTSSGWESGSLPPPLLAGAHTFWATFFRSALTSPTWDSCQPCLGFYSIPAFPSLVSHSCFPRLLAPAPAPSHQPGLRLCSQEDPRLRWW